MASKVRLEATISPFVLDELEQGNNIADISNFIEASYGICNELEKLLFLSIPKSAKKKFYEHPALQMHLEFLEDPQSSFAFAEVEIYDDCQRSTVGEMFNSPQTQEEAHRSIVNLLFERKCPYVFDYLSREHVKSECEQCKKSESCWTSYQQQTFSVGKLNFHKYADDFSIDLKQIFRKRKDYTLDEIKYAAILQGFLLSIPKEKLILVNDINVSKEFLGDIKSAPVKDFLEISMSLFRCVAFTRWDYAPDREDRSIDWHNNSPSKEDGFDLYRLDIIPATKSGKKFSGSKRGLFSIVKGKKLFLGYNPKHDFSIEIIKKRIKLSREMLDKFNK